jgi:hypothetical protein
MKIGFDPKQAMRVGVWGVTIGISIFLNRAAADDVVTLIAGATFKQAIGRQVRGQVQSESSSEVVVLLNASTIKVPAGLVLSIR